MNTKNKKENLRDFLLASLIGGFFFIVSWGGFDFVLESRRILHVAVSLILVVICSHLFSKNAFLFVFSLFIVFFIGVGKEVLDPFFDTQDILANLLGISLAFLVILGIEALKT